MTTAAGLRVLTPLFAITVLVACGAGSKPVTISPDDTHYCDHCPCTDPPRPPSCPMHDANLCTLPALQRALPNGPYLRCGTYMLYTDGAALDHGEEWAFDATTGALVGWRGGGGIGAMMCRDGYRTYWEKWPSKFVFPARETCKPAGALYGDPEPK